MSKKSVEISNDFCPQTLFLYGTKKENGEPNFGLFCWISYYANDYLGMMACISEDKLTRDRIEANGVFSANLVTEKLLPFADYCGTNSGYDEDKMSIDIAVENGRALDVPILSDSPVSFELEVAQKVELENGRIYLCKIRNVLVNEELTDSEKSVEERIREIAPISTTCSNYFSWSGKELARWGDFSELSRKK